MEIDIGHLHHAYVVLGTPRAVEECVVGVLTEIGVSLESNPDLHFFREPLFGISEARMLKERAARSAFTGRKVFVILSDRLNREAQNALLKIFEEPTPNTHFFIAALHEDVLLPTLRSRMQMLRAPESAQSAEKTDRFSPEHFLSLTPSKRLDFAKKFKESERPLGAFLDAMLLHLKREEGPSEVLARIFSMRRYADDAAADPRMILEHLALVLK